ncbi:hypothetical protein Bbelb_421340 [Branchiostoma belcheri]|nr:hypothetical protein Bbelb_421340 [Branchiostoma belcheri]
MEGSSANCTAKTPTPFEGTIRSPRKIRRRTTNLQGQAKRQVAVLSTDDQKDKKKVSDGLKATFGDTALVSAIMGMFNAREQERGGSITVCGLSLQELLKRGASRRR